MNTDRGQLDSQTSQRYGPWVKGTATYLLLCIRKHPNVVVRVRGENLEAVPLASIRRQHVLQV